jgi:hypothetical protein
VLIAAVCIYVRAFRPLVNRWVTEKMDEFDHTSAVVVLSPSRKNRRREEEVIDLEGLVGKDVADTLVIKPTATVEEDAGLATVSVDPVERVSR